MIKQFGGEICFGKFKGVTNVLLFLCKLSQTGMLLNNPVSSLIIITYYYYSFPLQTFAYFLLYTLLNIPKQGLKHCSRRARSDPQFVFVQLRS